MPMIERQRPPPEKEPVQSGSNTEFAISQVIGWIIFFIVIGGVGALFGLPLLAR